MNGYSKKERRIGGRNERKDDDRFQRKKFMTSKTIILSVDTTSPSGSVALLEDGSLLSEFNSDSASTFSERLLPSIDCVLQTQSMTIQDIDAFALAVGPGSFTGIRIGVSTVKSLAEASDKPVVPVSSLEALALKLLKQDNRLFCPLIDAKKGEIYGALFESAAGHIKEVVPQGAYSPERLFGLLPSRRKISFIGSGVNTYRKIIVDHFRDRAHLSARSLFIAFEVGRIGHVRLMQNKGVPGRAILPLYFRKSQAEEGHR
jgi:tRNA threonylcarbamoyladenosine biosynthesis protein TsaB